MNIVRLENWRYTVLMAGGFRGDSWRLTGNAYDHPDYANGHEVHTSTPVELDEVTLVVKTASGRTYQLCRCAGKLEEQLQYIREDIQRGGSKRF